MKKRSKARESRQIRRKSIREIHEKGYTYVNPNSRNPLITRLWRWADTPEMARARRLDRVFHPKKNVSTMMVSGCLVICSDEHGDRDEAIEAATRHEGEFRVKVGDDYWMWDRIEKDEALDGLWWGQEGEGVFKFKGFVKAEKEDVRAIRKERRMRR